MTQTDIKNREDASFVLARNAVGLRYEDIPLDVVEITKKGILDTIAVILAASGTTAEIRILVDFMKEAGGKGESTVLGYGDRMPAWHAGFLNGAMSHCLDYDDNHGAGAGHINAPVVPGAIALAERLGRVSGKELITAVAVGVDLLCRLSLSARVGERLHDWCPMPTDGVFASAMACGKLLNLNQDQMVNALGIAFIQAGGTMEIIHGLDSNIRGIYNAPPGEVGVRAALLAQRGITGVRNSIEGRAGLMNVYFGGKYDRDVLVGELGKRFPVLSDGFKPWPSCGFTQVFIDMSLELVRQHDIRPEQVESITVVVGDFARDLCEPPEAKRKPATTMVAKFSIPFCTAVAIARRKVTIGDFVGEGLKEPAVLRLAQRVNYRYDARYDFKPNQGMPPGEIEIKTTEGRVHHRKQEVAYGHPRKPMSWDDLTAKFIDCASYSAIPLPGRNVAEATRMLTKLEEVPNVSEVMGLLASTDARTRIA